MVVVAERFGRLEVEQGLQIGRVPLPGDRGDAEAVAEEETVAGVQRIGERELGRGAIERAGQQAASAIGHVDDQRAVAGGRVLGADQDEVAAEADAAIGAARGAFEVGDAPVVFQQRIDRVAQPGADQLEGAGLAECLAIGVGSLVGDFDSFDGHG